MTDSSQTAPSDTTGGAPDDLRDVFLCHASQDGVAANGLVGKLEAAGLRCWIAPRDVTPGVLYAEAILKAINGTRLLVVLLSKDAAASPHVSREIERASSKRHPIIAIRTDDTPLPPAFEYFLSESHWLEAAPGNVDAIAPKLVQAVRQLRTGTEGAGPAHALQMPMTSRTTAMRPRAGLTAIVLLIVTIAIGAILWRFTGTASDRVHPQADAGTSKSIAVLPFADMSAAKDQEYFADGMAEEIINSLAQIDSLKVAGRTSSFSYKGKNANLKVIGETLGVATILEGSVRKQGDRLRITAQLLRASDGFHMWSDTYDGTLADIFDLQERIAREITTKLKVVLAPGSERLVATATASPEAYALFVEAQGLVSRRTDLPHAINLLNRATALDPNFARAWSKLAVANMVAPQYSPLSWKSAWKAGEVAARRALALDPTSAESYAALGYMYLSERRYTDMDAAFTQALALNGHDVTTLYWAANGLTSMGRVAAAEKLLDQILREDPVNALTLQYKGITRFAKGDFAAAQKYSLAGIAAGIKIAHMIPSQIGAEAGTYDSATTDFTIGFGSIISAFNEVDLATIFHGTYADGAARASALAVVNKSSKDVLAPTMYLFISEPSRAFSEFEKSGSGLSDAFLDWLWLPTAYSRLARQHPAFQGFAKRLGMVDYWRKADWPDLCRAAPDRGPDAFTCD